MLCDGFSDTLSAVPTALTTFAVTLFVLAVFDPEKPRRHSKYAAPDTGILVIRLTPSWIWI
jgi:hypothetical protein